MSNTYILFILFDLCIVLFEIKNTSLKECVFNIAYSPTLNYLSGICIRRLFDIITDILRMSIRELNI